MKILVLLFVIVAFGVGFYALISDDYQTPNPDLYSIAADAKATEYTAGNIIRATGEAIRAMEIEKGAEIVQLTAQAQEAQSTGVAQMVSAQSTATAAFEATQSAVIFRATESAFSFQQTQIAADLQATQVARLYADQERALQLERQRQTNSVKAFFGYVLILGIVGTLVFFAFQLIKLRTIPKDRYAVYNGRVIDGALLPRSIVEINEAAPPVTQEEAAKIKERAQIVEGLRSMPQSAGIGTYPAGKGDQALQSLLLSPRVEVIEPKAIQPWVEEIENLILEDGND